MKKIFYIIWQNIQTFFLWCIIMIGIIFLWIKGDIKFRYMLDTPIEEKKTYVIESVCDKCGKKLTEYEVKRRYLTDKEAKELMYNNTDWRNYYDK